MVDTQNTLIAHSHVSVCENVHVGLDLVVRELAARERKVTLLHGHSAGHPVVRLLHQDTVALDGRLDGCAPVFVRTAAAPRRRAARLGGGATTALCLGGHRLGPLNGGGRDGRLAQLVHSRRKHCEPPLLGLLVQRHHNEHTTRGSPDVKREVRRGGILRGAHLVHLG